MGGRWFSKKHFRDAELMIGGIMAIRTSRYPLGKLLLDQLAHSHLSLYQFVLAIGYRNPSKGIIAFDSILAGSYDQCFMKRWMQSSFAPHQETSQQAITQTNELVRLEAQKYEAERKEEERAAFRPFLQAVPECQSPTPITFHAITGGHRRYTYALPADLASWNTEEQLRYIKQQIAASFSAAQGRTLFMGRIIGYRLFRWYDCNPALFSVNGELLERLRRCSASVISQDWRKNALG